MPTASVGARAPAVGSAPLNPLYVALVGNSSLSDDEAERVIARATAEHEMRRP